MEIGDKIKYLRKNKKLSQQEFADKLNVSRQSISRWELGNSTPDIKTLQDMCDIFDITLDTFLDNNDYKESKNDSIKKSNETKYINKILTLSICFLSLIVFLTINNYFNNASKSLNDTSQILLRETEDIKDQLYKTMKNRNISLPYPNVSPDESEQIENELLTLYQRTSEHKTRNDEDRSSIQLLQSRQEYLLNIISRQQEILKVYIPLSNYFERDFLNQRGEWQFSYVKNIEINDEDILLIEQNLSDVSNETLNRSFSRALAHVTKQAEERHKISIKVRAFAESENYQSVEDLTEFGKIEEYEKLKEEILMIDNLELQNEMLELISLPIQEN